METKTGRAPRTENILQNARRTTEACKVAKSRRMTRKPRPTTTPPKAARKRIPSAEFSQAQTLSLCPTNPHLTIVKGLNERKRRLSTSWAVRWPVFLLRPMAAWSGALVSPLPRAQRRPQSRLVSLARPQPRTLPLVLLVSLDRNSFRDTRQRVRRVHHQHPRKLRSQPRLPAPRQAPLLPLSAFALATLTSTLGTKHRIQKSTAWSPMAASGSASSASST